jgi:hypothetical protein
MAGSFSQKYDFIFFETFYKRVFANCWMGKGVSINRVQMNRNMGAFSN